MKVAIQAYRKYGGGYIARQKPIEKSVVEYYVDMSYRFFKPEGIYLIYDKDIKDFLKKTFGNDKKVNLVSLKDFQRMRAGDILVLDMAYFYDFKKLKHLIKKRGKLERARYFKLQNEQDIQNLKDFIKRDYRACWNPMAKYYKEPIGEWLAKLLKDTWITPNFLSISNILFFAIIFIVLIFEGSYLSMILLAILVHVYHILDITDGHLARLKNMKTSYGAWIDGAGDKFVFQLIFISISLSLFLKQNNVFYLIFCIFLLAGQGLHLYMAYLTDRFYPGHIKTDKVKMRLKNMGFTEAFLFFIENDSIYHMISLLALINRIGWLVIFYAVYFNLVWLSYVLYYSYKYIKTGN